MEIFFFFFLSFSLSFSSSLLFTDCIMLHAKNEKIVGIGIRLKFFFYFLQCFSWSCYVQCNATLRFKIFSIYHKTTASWEEKKLTQLKCQQCCAVAAAELSRVKRSTFFTGSLLRTFLDVGLIDLISRAQCLESHLSARINGEKHRKTARNRSVFVRSCFNGSTLIVDRRVESGT